MKNKIKQLFCRHEWEKTDDRLHQKNKHFTVMVGVYRCKKCGKVYK